MNNSLVKDYFRAIKEIRPIAFVMENVSMLESEKHRFYESYIDNEEIQLLIDNEFNLPKRDDSIFISSHAYEAVNLIDIVADANLVKQYQMPKALYKLLNTLSKHYGNEKRMDSFLQKQSKIITKIIESYLVSIQGRVDAYHITLSKKLTYLTTMLNMEQINKAEDDVLNIIGFQKSLISASEIYQNRLIGKFINTDGTILFATKSFSVIDYINAILGDDYVQQGGTLNAEWFGVPQYRRRHIIVGIRKDKYKGGALLPQKQENVQLFTVWDAIKDLESYEASYDKDAPSIAYNDNDDVSSYGNMLRKESLGVSNHLTTKTTAVAMERFKAIEPGKNFHSLSNEMKSTYTKPERTQNTIYLRLNPAEPSGTVVNVRKSMWIHPKLDRAITVREAARLQSFPDNFIFCGTKDSQFQQVGNAVPPLLAKAIATNLKNIL